jgi:alginate O-acetyltransferase complex protein AlgJ
MDAPTSSTTRERSPRGRIADRVVIALFLAVLVTPMLALGVGVGLDKDSERRFEQWNPFPEWSWRPKKLLRYPPALQRYYNARFAFRGALMRSHAWLKIKLFNVSSTDRVTLGKDGWLFYAADGTLDDYRRIRPFTNAELDGWTRMLVQRRDWLRKRGIPFLFTIAPNPQTLYSEFMPESVRRSNNPSRMDQLLAHLRQTTDIDVLDLRPALLAMKQHERVAYMTDTHWNQIGGFVAYQEIARWMRRRLPALRTFTLEDFERVDVPKWHGGLSYFLGAPQMFSETRVELRPRTSVRVTTDGQPLSADESLDLAVPRRRVDRRSDDGEVASALFIRDSQFGAPAQFLSRHFRHSVLLWQPTIDPAVVDEIRPQVVVQQIAERLLMGDVPVDPELPE